jgi:two-component system OmpR family sensor kinase
LAIVATIVQGVGAEMSFASPATGRADGFEVVVQFARPLQRGQGSPHGS